MEKIRRTRVKNDSFILNQYIRTNKFSIYHSPFLLKTSLNSKNKKLITFPLSEYISEFSTESIKGINMSIHF